MIAGTQNRLLEFVVDQVSDCHSESTICSAVQSTRFGTQALEDLKCNLDTMSLIRLSGTDNFHDLTTL